MLTRQKPQLGQLPDYTRFPWPNALWPFIKAGNLIDLSGNKLTGTFNGNPQWIGSALDLDGTGDYVTVVDNNKLGFQGANDNFTIIAKIRPDVINAHQGIVYKDDSEFGPTNDDFWRMHLWSDNKITCSLDAIDFSSATGVCAVGVDVHIAGVFDKSGYGRIYINGVASGTPVALNNEILNLATQKIYIGHHHPDSGGDFDFDGLIYYVMILPFALTAQQITYLYQHHFPWFEEDPVSHLYVPGAPPTVKPAWYYNQMTAMMRRSA